MRVNAVTQGEVIIRNKIRSAVLGIWIKEMSPTNSTVKWSLGGRHWKHSATRDKGRQVFKNEVIKSVKSDWKFTEGKYCKVFLAQKEVTGDHQKKKKWFSRAVEKKTCLENCVVGNEVETQIDIF